jgi:NAD(P)-dependent dehydrogenase (short-subunit alcohol dehydrogenase family)
VEAFGKVHVLCNNAGVGAGGFTWETTNADWEWVLGVNLWGVIHGVRTFLPAMIAHGEEGHVVNTASMAGLVSGPFMGPYNVSKYGVVALSETLLHELRMAAPQVGVSVLCPGFVSTRIGESGRNRPAELPARQAVDPGPGGPQLQGLMAERIAAGTPPSEIAAEVFEAVRDGRFYILTHPEMKPAIESRFSAIMGDGVPGSPGFV